MNTWWLRIGKHGLDQWPGLLAVTGLILLKIGLDVAKPWPLKLIVDHVLQSEKLPEALSWISRLPASDSPEMLLVWLAASTVLIVLLVEVVQAIQGYVKAGVGTRMVLGLGARLFDHIQRLSLVYHGGRKTGDLVRRITTDVSCVRALLIGIVLPALTSFVTLIVMFWIMWRLDATLSLWALAIVPLMVILIKVFDRPMTERSYDHQQLEGELMSFAEQTLSAIPAVKSFGREADMQDVYSSLSARTLKAYLRSISAQINFSLGVGASTALGTGAILLIGGFHVLDGDLSIGGLLVFLSYLSSLYAPLETLTYLTTDYAHAAASGRRVLEVLETKHDVPQAPNAIPVPSRSDGEGRRVAFESVTFGYETGRPILHEVTFEAGPGETVALVGESGAGKSTIAGMVLRLYDPWQGKVLLDGVDLGELQIGSLRAEISYVSQDVFLFPVSVADNIAYGNPTADREEIEAAARAANAHEFITDLPDGYDTFLGERGSSISGGERQRLSIARAILKDAPVLVLDEPTSALDVETEHLIMDALRHLMARRTTIVIAHRLSTVRAADRILVIDAGRVVESGSHKQLFNAHGPYRRLFEAYFSSDSTLSARVTAPWGFPG